jgi:hypothetical protein
MTGHPGLLDADRVRTSFRPTEACTAEERLDDLIDGYVNWRESACAVGEAYVRWSGSGAPERAMRFAAYTATLDQEQKMAAAYAETVTDVERLLERSSHRGI